MRKIGRAAYGCVLCLASCTPSWGQVDIRPLDVTLCDLYRHPEKYAGKMVKVRATVAARTEIRIDAFTEKPCSSWMGVLLVFPEQAEPATDAHLVRDDSFKQFEEALHHRGPINIEATFEGRFDSVVILQDGKRVRVGKGYGKKRDCDGRILLHKVSNVLARILPRK